MTPAAWPIRSRASRSACRLEQPLEDYPFARTYIRAVADVPDAPGTIAFERAAERARSSAAWHYREIACNHMVASNRPAELAEILGECAR